VFVRRGVAMAEVEESERVSAHKMGNVANFYQMKLTL
jgi:hypothetical protein